MHDWVEPVELSRIRATLADEESERRLLLANRRGRLARLLAVEVLPHVLATGSAPVLADPDGLARRLVAGQFEEARETVTARLASGASAQSVMLDDIAPAARRLGAFWSADDCDFFEVTRAAGALSDLLREIAPDEAAARAVQAPSIIVAPAPGETHALGARIVARVFGFAGWRSLCCAEDELHAALAREWFDVAGFSLSCDRYAGSLPGAVAAARAASRNSGLAILVGGPALAARPDLAEGLGADLCVADRDIAVQLPNTLLRALRL